MEILERYLQAIGEYLPATTRQDTLAELRANLLEAMDGRAEELGRPLTDAEVSATVQKHGAPLLVAVRYLPQRYLIGPVAFPIYVRVLRRALPFVLLVYAISRAAVLAFAPTGASPLNGLIAGLIAALLQLVPVLLIFWAVVTIVFASIEEAQRQRATSIEETVWDTCKLPPLRPSPVPRKPLQVRIADLGMHCVWLVYVLAVPAHPYLLLGPGTIYLCNMHVHFAPVWRQFFVLCVAGLLVQLAIKAIALSGTPQPWRKWAALFADGLGVASIATLAMANTFLVPSAGGFDMPGLNHGIGIAARVCLACGLIAFSVNLWKALRQAVPVDKLAF